MEQSRLEHARSLNKKQLKEEEAGRQVRAAFVASKKELGSQVKVEEKEHAKVKEKEKEQLLASNRLQADRVRSETADEVRRTPNWTVGSRRLVICVLRASGALAPYAIR